MKTAVKLFTLALLSFAFSSCCGLGPCGSAAGTTEKIVGYDTKEVPIAGSKNGLTKTQKTPIVETVDVPCPKCSYTYCPKRGCCGTLSKQYIARKSAQGFNGAPNIGLIPTMKKLAE